MAPKRQYPGAGDVGADAQKRSRTNGAPALSKTIEDARKRAMDAFKRSGLPQDPGAARAGAPPARAAPNDARPRTEAPLSGHDTQYEEETKPTGIHPLLLGDAARIQERFRSLAPKFASVQANQRMNAAKKPPPKPKPPSKPPAPEKTNPYLTDESSAGAASDVGPTPKRRSMHRSLQFNRPGVHIMAAEQARRDAQMEQLKLRIEESARKAGVHDELLGDERILRVSLMWDARN